MNRLVPYRTKASEEVVARIGQTLSTTMYLVQTSGPTSYVIQEQNCEKKHKVLIGSLQTCSCGTADICIHILFVMLKVLRVPATTPVVWQKSLIDFEIEMLLAGGYREKAKPVPKKYMKRRKEESSVCEPGDADVERHELVEGEVCAICQEDMEHGQPLTFCRKGCGNNFHIECMKVFGESRRQSKENIVCPLCRQDWGGEALTSLRKAIDAANRAPNVHKDASCRKCKTKPIRCERYRCVQCKNVDLCARCFKSNAHSSHAFVMKQNTLDPWIPALRENQPRAAISSDIIRDLETRELSTNDYDVLLQLDSGDKYPIQDYLVKMISGTKINAESAKAFGVPGTTCSLCTQSLQMKAALHSTLCGHVFHESCLARSILSQVYVCPFPGCEHTLVPGLRYLQKKPEKHTVQYTAESKHELQTAVPSPNASFTVIGLQQHIEDQSPRAMKPRVAISRAAQKEHNRHEDDEIRALPGLVSFGISQHERTTRSLPALSQCGASNQLEHEAIVCSSRTSSTQSAPRRKGKISKTALLRNTLPPIDQRDLLPLFPQDNNLTEIRLNHAEKIRSEIKAVESERLQKLRMLREERRQRHNESINAPALVGFFLGANERGGEPMQNTQGTRAPRRINLKRKPKERQHIREHDQRPISLPDLFIGSKR
ncbi:hypothetical protein DVH05_008292 [Phytophthora capsici]|nr:hypothetical protein DVH05_008292 [Phytophthora capsici]